MSQGFAAGAKLGIDTHVGQTIQVLVADSPYTFTKADYPGLYGVRVKCQAGGGGAGGCPTTSSTDVAASGGGGGGAYAESVILAKDLGDTEIVTVGAGGGGGGSGSVGGDGGDSSFGTHVVAAGGRGGDRTGVFSNSYWFSCDGGNPGRKANCTGDLIIEGGAGGIGMVFINSNQSTSVGGLGGASYLGNSEKQSRAVSAQDGGQAGSQYGGGASGVAQGRTEPSIAGQDGADGIVIIEVLYDKKLAEQARVHNTLGQRDALDAHSQYVVGNDLFPGQFGNFPGVVSQSYTSGLRATVSNPVAGSGGGMTGWYIVLGELVFMHFHWRWGATPSSGSGDYYIDLPFNAHIDDDDQLREIHGYALYRDASATQTFHLALHCDVNTRMKLLIGDAGAPGSDYEEFGPSNYPSSTQPGGNGDTISGSFFYRRDLS